MNSGAVVGKVASSLCGAVMKAIGRLESVDAGKAARLLGGKMLRIDVGIGNADASNE